MLTGGHLVRRAVLAVLAVALTVGGLSAVQPRASAAPVVVSGPHASTR